MSVQRPIGILGGTFDPVHNGHLRLALEAHAALDLAEVRFIPTGTPPHRAAPGASAGQRLDMTRLAIVDNPAFSLDDREIRRDGGCYSVDTLSELRAELGAEQPLCLLVGADAFAGLESWRRWRELFGLAHIVVARRPGHELVDADLPAALAVEVAARRVAAPAGLAAAPAGHIAEIAIPPLAISASAIRAALAAGRSPRYLLPDAVLDYIQRNHLYQH